MASGHAFVQINTAEIEANIEHTRTEIEARYPRTPILLTTGYARRLDSEPRYPVLRKPYDIVELDDAINQAMTSNQRLGGELSGNSLPLCNPLACKSDKGQSRRPKPT